MQKKPLTKDEALLKMASLCARSEQCEFDIVRKLRNYGLGSREVADVVGELTERKFLDEARYARAFSRDKVRFSSWGKMKIRAALLAKRVPEQVIREAFEDVEESDYSDAVMRAARAKAASLDLSQREERVKLYRHLLSRGFESDIASKAVKQILAQEGRGERREERNK